MKKHFITVVPLMLTLSGCNKQICEQSTQPTSVWMIVNYVLLGLVTVALVICSKMYTDIVRASNGVSAQMSGKRKFYFSIGVCFLAITFILLVYVIYAMLTMDCNIYDKLNLNFRN